MKRKKLAKNILPPLIISLLLCLLTSCDGKSENTKPADSNSSAAKTGDGSEASFNLTLATLNIKHGAEGLDKIAEAIKDISPDIIGLEEVDVNCERSGCIDETKEISELAGYEYYAFSKAISLGDGEYGTAILSRCPIESFEVIPLDSGSGEDRSLGHAVIDLNGLKIDAFVTHLSWENSNLRINQMKDIAGILEDCDRYVLMGDFNCFNIDDFTYLGGDYYVNRPDRKYTTFYRYDMAIDNIVVSEGFTETDSGVSDKECSDHKLLYAVFEYKK